MENGPYQLPTRKRPRRWLERAAIRIGIALIVVSFALEVYRYLIRYYDVEGIKGTAEYSQKVDEIWEYRRRVGHYAAALLLSGAALAWWGRTVEEWRDTTDFS